MLPGSPWTDELFTRPALLEMPNSAAIPSPVLSTPVLIFSPCRNWPTDFSRSHITIPLQKACYVVSTTGHGIY